jgi:hypothetical protein
MIHRNTSAQPPRIQIFLFSKIFRTTLTFHMLAHTPLVIVGQRIPETHRFWLHCLLLWKDFALGGAASGTSASRRMLMLRNGHTEF